LDFAWTLTHDASEPIRHMRIRVVPNLGGSDHHVSSSRLNSRTIPSPSIPGASQSVVDDYIGGGREAKESRISLSLRVEDQML
jgi:hypothetical protein